MQQNSQTHSWRWNGKRWLCSKCLRFAKRNPPRDACQGYNPKFAQLVQEQFRGHELFVAEYRSGEEWLLICKRCGCMAEGGVMLGLRNACNREFRSVCASNNWKRVLKLQHPKPSKGTARMLENVYPISQLLDSGERQSD